MPQPTAHRSLAADVHAVPRPFRHFAVRSDEPQHAWQARAPYCRVHLIGTDFLPPDALAGLAAQGWARIQLDTALDITHASTTPADLCAAAPGVPDLPGRLADALRATGVLGPDPARYRQATTGRIDYLGCRGAGFHNDVTGHWSRCLFWVLALDLADVDFVLPHAGLRLPLAPGDLLVFDQTLAHGLCRPADAGQALAASFETGGHDHQLFLTGELLLDDADWAALGAPWLPVEAHAAQDALDLMVASFDASSGHIQRLHALRGAMLRSTCHADLPEG
ncbi:MAG: hypothetical protein QE285_17080 [Aquabacterium sp.]|nr:hypothetical protein [Aquabacterium sp.]